MSVARKLQNNHLSVVSIKTECTRKSTKGQKFEKHAISWKEATTLLKAMRDDKKNANTRLMLAVAFFTGLRISDVLRITWNDLLNCEKFTITEKKTGKTRIIEVLPPMRTIAQQVYNGQRLDGYCFISTAYNSKIPNKIITTKSAIKRVQKIFKKYGIKTDGLPGCHTLRKTWATQLYESHGKTEAVLILICRAMNHSSIRQTLNYIGVTDQKISNLNAALTY